MASRKTFPALVLGENGTMVPKDMGTGHKRQVTQRVSRYLTRQAGGDPLVEGVTSRQVDPVLFAAHSYSPKAMREKFARMAKEQGEFRAWKKQVNQTVD